MNEQEREYEIQHLGKTLEQIRSQLAVSEENCDQTRQELSTVMQDYWQAGASSSDEAQILDTMHRQKALSGAAHHKAKQLRRMLDSPYFGRIDFLERGYSSPEAIYIGIGSLTHSESGEFLVYDWRAPVSSMFYDYGRGDASYDCPAGTITGMITLKRQYKIRDGQLINMFDSDLKIDDSFLQSLLSKSADEKMHTIVNSIQREQNRIIRDETHRALFVEGPAGSGKTSVALHRVAFLLYSDRGHITSQNVLILSPNNIFSDYISNVLPEMGEDNVLQMTFQDYAETVSSGLPFCFEPRTGYWETVLAGRPDPGRVDNISYKTSASFAAALEAYLRWIDRHWVDNHPAIEVRGQLLITRQEWQLYYSRSFAAMPPVIRLLKIRTILQQRMRNIVAEARREKENELIAASEEVNPKTIKALSRLRAYEELHPVISRIERLTTFTAASEYRRLSEEDLLFETSSGFTKPRAWDSIRNYMRRSFHNGILPFEDIPAFLYFRGNLEGFALQSEIRHLVIDEAQDYTALQFQVLKRLFPNASWTIVGDPVQAVQPFLKTASFREAANILSLENTAHFQLTQSYRSTKEILGLCNALLPEARNYLAVNRSGVLPVIVQTVSPEGLADRLTAAVQSTLQDGWHSVGIICKNASQAEAVYSRLPSHLAAVLVTREEADFHRGVVVLPSYLAKGLEFDVVLVADAERKHYHTGSDRHILYTICTRALHRLVICYQDELSPFLAAVDRSLYLEG